MFYRLDEKENNNKKTAVLAGNANCRSQSDTLRKILKYLQPLNLADWSHGTHGELL